MLQGFENIEFSEVQTIPAKEAVKRFKFLKEYDPSVYIRKEKLTSSEIEQYTLMVTVPKNSTESYIRIFDPLIIVTIAGLEYLVNGNGRMETIAKLLKTSQLEIADIPFVVIQGEVDNDLLKRMQINYNDSTRQHKALEKLRMFHAAIDSAIDNGSNESDARKTVAEFYGVKQMTLTHSKMLFDEPNDYLIALIEEDTISTDTATHVIRTAKKHHLSVDDVIARILFSVQKKSSLKISQGDFVKWLKSFEADLLVSSQQNIEQIVKAKGKPAVLRFTETARAETIDTENTILSRIEAIPTISFSPDKIRVLSGILGTMSGYLTDDDSLILFDKLIALTSDFATREIPANLKVKLEEVLNKLAE